MDELLVGPNQKMYSIFSKGQSKIYPMMDIFAPNVFVKLLGEGQREQ
jgi:hypothetical protein